MSAISIKVENLSKYYNLGVINSGTLSRDLQSWLWKKMGKEDPNRKIGVHEDNAEGFWALKDLNFEIKKGERVGIIGKNGAGKSTLLKMLSQISAPTEGKIYINGKVASLLEVGTGFNPELTGRENIYMNGAILGMKKREIDAKIDEIIAFSEIERHIDTPVKRYSSGMYVRLAFAVAAHLDSDILIADEVLAVGDAAFQKKALGKMNELSTGQGRTVLFVSHNMNAVKQLCQRGIVLDKGRFVRDGEIEKSINWYLTEGVGLSNKSFKTFPDDLQKDFQLNSVYVLDTAGNNLSTFEAQKEIVIRIECTSRKPLPGLFGYFSIHNSEYAPVIIFDSKEQKESLMTNLLPGKYIFDIKIPAGVFSYGQYSVYMNFTSQFNNSGFNVDSPMDCCVFEVTDTLTERGNNRGAITSYIPEMKLIEKELIEN